MVILLYLANLTILIANFAVLWAVSTIHYSNLRLAPGGDPPTMDNKKEAMISHSLLGQKLKIILGLIKINPQTTTAI